MPAPRCASTPAATRSTARCACSPTRRTRRSNCCAWRSRSRASTRRRSTASAARSSPASVADASDPETAAQLTWSKAIYGDHPYARAGRGHRSRRWPRSPPTICRALHSRLFARDNLVVGVVGAIDAETLKKELDQLFGGLPEKAELTPVADVELEARPGDRRPLRPAADDAAASPIPASTRDKPEFFAAYLMNHILGGGDFHLAAVRRGAREARPGL